MRRSSSTMNMMWSGTMTTMVHPAFARVLCLRPKSDRCNPVSTLPLGILGEDVISILRTRVAREAACRIVSLRGAVRRRGGSERIGCGVILECPISPSAAIREPLAVLQHEVNVMQCAGNQRGTRSGGVRFRIPMDLSHLDTIWERLAVFGNAGLVGPNHRWIPENYREQWSIVANGNELPSFVSPELRKRESIRHFDRVPILGGGR